MNSQSPLSFRNDRGLLSVLNTSQLQHHLAELPQVDNPLTTMGHFEILITKMIIISREVYV